MSRAILGASLFVLGAACSDKVDVAASDAATAADGAIVTTDATKVPDAVPVDPPDVPREPDASTEEVIAIDAGAPSDVGAPPDASEPPTGCPPTEPVATQPCGGGPYYCFYYVSDTCPDAFKCTSGGGPPFAFYGFGPNCKVPPVDACAEGKACGDFEAHGGCVVPCDRYCHCGPTGTLTCAAIDCSH